MRFKATGAAKATALEHHSRIKHFNRTIRVIRNTRRIDQRQPRHFLGQIKQPLF